MGPGIIIPLAVVPVLLLASYAWYRRSIARLAPTEGTPVSGVRLTAEALHRLPSPPWRVVHEISGALGDVDHVIVGPAGVVAITTVVADRPDPDRLRSERGEAALVGAAAIARGPLDELLRPIGAQCRTSATVYWGTPDDRREAVDDLVHGSQLVEGQRLDAWASELAATSPPVLDPTEVETTWRHVVRGIGRPDPLP